MIDKKVIGTVAVGGLVLFLFLTMIQSPDTSQAIYFTNYTSADNTTYYGIDYIIANVSVNDSIISNPTKIRIDLYYENGTFKESVMIGDWNE